MFAGLFLFLLTGIPVAFGLAATGLLFGFVGFSFSLVWPQLRVCSLLHQVH
jgi:TRAP-type mannitol/chloroaromatic compound transport system permease large subunit